MLALPDLRRNLGTWAVAAAELPAVAAALNAALPREDFDTAFLGQCLATTYLDSPAFALRKARRRRSSYCTLRVRSYHSPAASTEPFFALSAKTEADKFRVAVPAEVGRALAGGRDLDQWLPALLPDQILARLAGILGEEPLGPVVCVYCRRFAVENESDRLTLDCAVATDTGKTLPMAVLEFKSTAADAFPPSSLATLGLRPLKVSKFLWATAVGG